MTKRHNPKSKPKNAPVTVLLLNYNGKEIFKRCLRSFAKLTVLPERILLIDNATRDFDAAEARKLVGKRCEGILEIAQMKKNLGYAKGMNWGIKKALADKRSEWVMTLNNDTEIDPDFFLNLAKAFKTQDAKVGMFAPKIRQMHARKTLDAAGIELCLDGMSAARGSREKDKNQYDEKTHILIPNGVSGIYRLKMLSKIGLFDEDFWAYCEDTELGLRAWFAGWNCLFLPECVVYHARSTSLGEHSLEKLYLVERNHYWVAARHFPLPLLLLNPIFTTYRYAIQFYALLTGQGQGNGYGEKHSSLRLMATSLKGVVHAGFGLPKVLISRRGLQRRRSMFEALEALWSNRMTFRTLILK